MFTKTNKADSTHRGFPLAGRNKYIIQSNMRKACWVEIFVGNYYKHIKLLLQGLLGFFYGYDYYKIDKRLLDYCKSLSTAEHINIDFSLGAPGPFQKNVALLSVNDNPLYILKIAATDKAKRLLINEASFLKILENTSLSIPKAFALEVIGSNFVLVQNVVTGNKIATEKDLQLIVNFVVDCASVLKDEQDYRNSKIRQDTAELFQEIEHCLDDVWVYRFKRGINVLEDNLVDIQTIISHRDLTPWNIRVKNSGDLCVFDWEYAASGYLPLYDIFHFVLMQRALKKGSINLHDASEVIFRISSLDWHGMHGLAYFPKLQLLGYLLNICIFYLNSKNGRCDSTSIIYRGYGDLIDLMLEDAE